MRRLAFLLILMVAGCNSVDPACQCTDQFVTVGVTVLNPAREPITDLEFTATMTRTQEVLEVQQTGKDHGYYVVIDDSFKNVIRSSGESIHTEMKRGPVNHAQAFEVDVPGRCKCHVSKLSGPDTLFFDG